MKIWNVLLLAWKRTARNGLFLLMLAALCLCVVFFGSIEKEVRLLPTGICLRDTDPEAVRLAQKLESDGFVPYADEESLKDAVARQEIGMGIAVKEGLSDRLAQGDMGGAAVLYCLPTASFVRVTSLRLSAHLGEIYAPYITQQLMENQGITLTHEQVRQYMEYCFEHDAQFQFQITDVAGRPLAGASYSRSLILGMLAVLLFVLMCLSTGTEKDGAYRNLHDRLGPKKAFFAVLLPSYGMKFTLAAASAAVAAVVCRGLYGTDVAGLGLWCGIYLLYLVGISAFVHATVYRFARVQLYVLALSLLSLGICPIFVDLAGFLPIPEWCRFLLPPYFFYRVPDAPGVYAAVAALVCVAGLAALYWRESRITPRTGV